MNDTAQIILAISTLVTALGTLILGLVNRGTLTAVQKQTDGMLATMQVKAEALGHAKGTVEEMQYQRDNPPPTPVPAPMVLPAEDPLKVEIVKVPPLKP